MRRAWSVVAVAVLLAAVLLVPMPLVVLTPGSALSVPAVIELGRPPDVVSGQLLLTTVGVTEPSIARALFAVVDDHDQLVLRRSVIPEGVDSDDYVSAQQQVFTESAQLAAAVGLRAAGLEARVSGSGVRVTEVLPDGPAHDKLREGDVITALNGHAIRVATDLLAATASGGAGDRLELAVERGDEQHRIRVQLEQVSMLGRPGLGVIIHTLDQRISLPFPVEVDSSGLGGPSAGLIIALSVYELVDEGDLLRGRTIAGTGTLDGLGRVAPVGGVRQKVDAAERAGASIFLVPTSEAAEARSAASGALTVVPVTTFDDALRTLRKAP